MDTNIEVRKYQPGDAPALNEMLKKVFGIEQDVRLWSWKYEENPRKENCSYVAVVGDRVVAHVGAIIVDLQIRGEKLIGCQLADLMSDPERRVKGAFTMAYMAMVSDVLEKEYRHFGFANPHSTKYVANSGFAMVGPRVPRLDRITKVAPIINRRINNAAISQILAFPVNFAIKSLYSVRASNRASKLRQGASIEEVTVFDERFDELWGQIAAGFPRTPIRGKEYLTWRYTAHPAHKYKIYAFVDQDKTLGYIVLRVMQSRDLKRGLIVDLITPSDQGMVWTTLLKVGIRYLIGEGVDLITCWMFKHMPYHAALKKLHFINRPSDLTVMIYGEKGKHDVKFLNDPKNWYVSMGDSDMW